MSDCKVCGRDEGHYLNCESMQTSESGPAVRECAVEGCTSTRWSDDKRVKYCEDHKDAKSRKE